MKLLESPVIMKQQATQTKLQNEFYFKSIKGTFTVEQGGQQVSLEEFTASEVKNKRKWKLAISEAARTLCNIISSRGP